MDVMRCVEIDFTGHPPTLAMPQISGRQDLPSVLSEHPLGTAMQPVVPRSNVIGDEGHDPPYFGKKIDEEPHLQLLQRCINCGIRMQKFLSVCRSLEFCFFASTSSESRKEVLLLNKPCPVGIAPGREVQGGKYAREQSSNDSGHISNSETKPASLVHARAGQRRSDERISNVSRDEVNRSTSYLVSPPDSLSHVPVPLSLSTVGTANSTAAPIISVDTQVPGLAQTAQLAQAEIPVQSETPPEAVPPMHSDIQPEGGTSGSSGTSQHSVETPAGSVPTQPFEQIEGPSQQEDIVEQPADHLQPLVLDASKIEQERLQPLSAAGPAEEDLSGLIAVNEDARDAHAINVSAAENAAPVLADSNMPVEMAEAVLGHAYVDGGSQAINYIDSSTTPVVTGMEDNVVTIATDSVPPADAASTSVAVSYDYAEDLEDPAQPELVITNEGSQLKDPDDHSDPATSLTAGLVSDLGQYVLPTPPPPPEEVPLLAELDSQDD